MRRTKNGAIHPSRLRAKRFGAQASSEAEGGVDVAEAAGGVDGAGAQIEHRPAAAAMDEAIEPAAA
jgi:hypothetical protein